MRIKNILRSFIKILKEKQLVPIMTQIDKEKVLLEKVALITGGSSGIGLSIAESFLNSGCKVIIAGSNEDKLKTVVGELGNSANLKYIVIDVLDVSLVADRISQATTLFDENRIDILVNSAGVHHSLSFENMTEEEFDIIMDTNVKGTFFVCQSMAKHMIENKVKGNILNISSSSALRPAWGPYQMSKWAINGFTLGLAKQLLPHGIVVNSIAPGQTATPMIGKKTDTDNIYNDYVISGRYIMPAEIAQLATFMVSDMGRMIVGDTFYMTGGSGVITTER